MDTANCTLRCRLRFELLEDRRLLSITVDTLVDEFNGVGIGAGTSLREAIFASPSGDAINFSVTGAIELSALGELTVNKSLVINGPGADLLTIRAYDPTPALKNGDGSRVFNIDDGNDSIPNLATITGVALTGGDVNSSGGAIYARESLTLANCTVTGNAAGYSGGAVAQWSSSHLAIVGSTISGNTSSGHGGGISKVGPGNLTIANSTISGNSANTGTGGGVYAGSFTYSAAVFGSTITGNSASSAGGIFADPLVALTLENSIVAGNSASQAGPDVRRDSGAISIHYTLVGDNSGTSLSPAPVGSPDANGNLIGTAASPIDPMLGALAANAGPTMTHALLPGSPALDAGDPAAVAGVGDVPLFDQRGAGLARVLDGDGDAAARIDMGAFESQGVLPALAGDYNLNRSVDAADYVVWRKTLGGSAPPYSGADGSGDGTINQGDRDVWTTHFGNSLSPPASALPTDEFDPPEIVAEFVRIPTNHPTSRDISHGIEITSNKAPARTPRASAQPSEQSFLAERHDRAILAWLSATVLTSRRTGNDAGAVPQADDSQFDAPPAGDTASLDVALAILEF